MWHAFVTIAKEEGVMALFKGLPMRLIYVTPSAAVSFALYEQFKRMLRNYQNNPTFPSSPPAISMLQPHPRNPPLRPDSDPGESDLFDTESDAYNPREQSKKYEPLIWLTAGAAARLIGTAARTPFDIVKQRMQVQGSLKQPRMFLLLLLLLLLFLLLLLLLLSNTHIQHKSVSHYFL